MGVYKLNKESMATCPSPSTASPVAQQAIQLLRLSQGQSGTDRKTVEKAVFKLSSCRTTVAEVPYMEGFICKRKSYVDAGKV